MITRPANCHTKKHLRMTTTVGTTSTVACFAEITKTFQQNHILRNTAVETAGKQQTFLLNNGALCGQYCAIKGFHEINMLYKMVTSPMCLWSDSMPFSQLQKNSADQRHYLTADCSLSFAGLEVWSSK